MSISTWLSGTLSHSDAGRGRRRNRVTTSPQRRHTVRPSLEALEIRLTLSLTTLASFASNNGGGPVGGVIMDSSGNLYGTTLPEAVYLLYGFRAGPWQRHDHHAGFVQRHRRFIAASRSDHGQQRQSSRHN